LKVRSGVNEAQPARLELYSFDKSTAKEKSKLQDQICFHSVNDISINEDGSISLKLNNDRDFSFFTDLNSRYQWIQYCNLLWSIPNHYVPEEPNYEMVPQNFTDRFKDPSGFNASKAKGAFLYITMTFIFIVFSF